MVSLPRNAEIKNAPQNKMCELILSAVAAQIDELGAVTIFDFTIQNLSAWQEKPGARPGSFFTYRVDDLVDASSPKTESVKLTMLEETPTCKIARLELAPTANRYDYGKLFKRAAKTCADEELLPLVATYFDHTMYESGQQSPFLVLIFRRAE